MNPSIPIAFAFCGSKSILTQSNFFNKVST